MTIQSREFDWKEAVEWKDPELQVTFEKTLLVSSNMLARTVYEVRSALEKPVGCKIEVLFPRDKLELKTVEKVCHSIWSFLFKLHILSLTFKQ